MGWKKYFKPVNSVLPSNAMFSNNGMHSNHDKYSTWLPEVYQGPPNRIQRYIQYDQMDIDYEINSALDTIAEFCTQLDNVSDLPFVIKYHNPPSETEAMLIKDALSRWCKLNEFNRRIFKIFRSSLKYGDQVFVRDPETFKLYWIEPSDVEKIIVNESKGKDVEAYFIHNLDLNTNSLTASNLWRDPNSSSSSYNSYPQSNYGGSVRGNVTTISDAGGNYNTEEAMPVAASNIVHLSLSDGMEKTWPFGVSILETVYKTYKQKELLEDSVLIYRIQRAPERRVFYVDVGDMPPHKAQQYLERVRYEVQQKRIPSKTGGGVNIADAAYNPMCLTLDTRIPLLDGRTLALEELISEYEQGKENWAYSCDPDTGKVVPGNITWAGITREDAEVLRITFDNGETLTCTPDHKIPVLGKGFVEAQHLTEDDPLISFETKNKSVSNKDESYQQVFDHELNDWVYTHQVVAEFFKNINKHKVLHFSNSLVNAVKDTVQHSDHDIYNNDPRNLCWMNAVDNILYNSFNKKGHWAEPTNPDEVKAKIRQSLKDYCDNMVGEDSEHTTQYDDVNVSQSLLTRIVEIVKEHDSNMRETIKLANADSKLLGILEKDNAGFNSITNDRLVQIYGKFGYKSWDDFKNKIQHYNHRITKIERLDERVTTGTITIDGEERWHTHHTFAIESGIFVKNSSMEDYFFAQACLVLDTLIPLMDGRTLTLQEIINECKDGKENFVYSKNTETLEPEAGKIVWADVTRKDAQLVRVHLDNGEYIDATPDHRFILQDGTEVEAEDLSEGNPLLSSDTSVDCSVATVEWLEEREDTGDITIETESGSHIFATSAGVFVHNSDGKGSKVETLPGGENLGEIDDMLYFNNKLFRALGVPSSYLPTGGQDGTASYTDGRVGTAYIQEYRFSEKCKRHQRQLISELDKEFKLYLKHKGIMIDGRLFDIEFTVPQNFSQYRQIELDAAQTAVYTNVADNELLSRRFALKKYLGLSEQEIKENEKLWKEENGYTYEDPAEKHGNVKGNLNQVGIPTSDLGGDEFSSDDPDINIDDESSEDSGDMEDIA